MNIPFYFINCGELEWAWQQLKYNSHGTQLGYTAQAAVNFILRWKQRSFLNYRK